MSKADELNKQMTGAKSYEQWLELKQEAEELFQNANSEEEKEKSKRCMEILTEICNLIQEGGFRELL